MRETVIPIEAYERLSSKKPRFKRINTNEIMGKEFDPIQWSVPGYVPEGFTLLIGRPKLGKTWLALDWSLAVACGGIAMGAVPVEAGDVLYIDLENGERRVQRRIRTLFPSDEHRPDLSRLEWVTEAPALDKGFIDALEDWRDSVTNPRLVIIDVLQRIKPAGNSNRNAYENDYSSWAPLQKWAIDNGIAVVGLHHTKKGGAEDQLEASSGSNGLTGAADTVVKLDRGSGGITLYVRGRDVDEKESAMLFASGMWTITGEAAAVRLTHERSAILEALLVAIEPMSPSEISDATRMRNQNVRQTLSRMARDGEVIKVGRGLYAHPGHVPPPSQWSQCHNRR